MTSVVSAGISEGDLASALDGFAAAVGAEHVLTDEADLREFRDPFAYETWDEYTASAVVLPDTVEEIQEIVRLANLHKVSALDARHRPQQRLRRSGTTRSRLGDPQPAPDEPRAGAQRGARLRRRRAGRALVRPLRGDPVRRSQADALRARPRLGQRRRQHARPRHHLSAVRDRHGRPVRHGGRPRRTAS